MEKWVKIAKEQLSELLLRMEIETDIEGYVKEGDICLEIKSDEGGILIGKQGRTLDSLQLLINRMVNKQLKEPLRVVLDVADYRKKRGDFLKRMAIRVGEDVRKTGKEVSIGPFSSHDRRIVHLILKEEPSLETVSVGDGELKRIKIIPTGKGG